MSHVMNAGPSASPTPWQRVEANATTFLWIGRALAAAMLVISGGFFVEHLNGWFLDLKQPTPPTWVAVGLGIHLAMLAGLAISLHWTRLGSAILLLATPAFIVETGVNLHYFPLITLFTLAPVIVYAAWWKLHRDAQALKTAQA